MGFGRLLARTRLLMQPTFRERYCAKTGIRPEDFESHVLARALYAHAKPFRALLDWSANYFAADRDFVRCVGDIRSRRQFHAEAGEFRSHPRNKGFFRRALRLRVSAEKLRVLMESAWGSSESVPPVAPAEVSSRKSSSHS